MRLILTGPHAGRACEDLFAEICDADTIDTVEAARIVRQHNDTAAKAEKAVPVVPTTDPDLPTWPDYEASAVTFRVPPKIARSQPSFRRVLVESKSAPAPIVDAEHPPEGYRLATDGEKREPGDMYWSYIDRRWEPGMQKYVGQPRCGNIIANPLPKPLPGAQGLAEKVQEIQASAKVDDSAQVIQRQNRDLTEAARRIVDLEYSLAKAEDERNAWRAGHQERTHEADTLRSEVARLKRQRLILTAWMRMFRGALFQWMANRPTLRKQVVAIAKSWNNHPRHGAAWLKSKEGAKP